MSYLNYDGLAYFKSKLTNWVDQNYLSKTNTGNLTVAGHVTFTNPITGDLDGKAKKDWLGQKIDETYIKSIATNDNAGTIVYTKGNGSTNHILIDLLQGATPIANGRAGLVPAPTVSEMNYFLRGDGNWAVPTDVYVNQNLIASSNNNQFPVLLSGTSGTPATKTNATVGYTNVVSVNPLTNALMASQFISKHPTYNRQSTVTSKVQYSLNFTDVVSGAGHNLGEVVGYVDTPANGGEHELGLRLFGNPNVQGTEEDYVYMGVGLSKTNVAYGHAPSTPLPADHNEPTDIITRDWLARNGSETGLVHTSMNETISGIKTFTDETRNTSSAGITTTKLTASGKITGTGTAEISGGSGNTPSLKVTGNETVTGDLSVGGNETVVGNETVTGNVSTTNGNISTTNGTVSGKTGSIGTGGLTVTGPSNLNGKVTAGNGLDVTGNETVSGNLTVGGTTTTEDLHVTDDAIIDNDLTISGDIFKKINNTTQEYVTYVTNQQDVRETIINNLIKANGGLAQDSNKNIYVKTGDGIKIDSGGYVTTRLQTNGGLQYTGSTANLKELAVKLAINGGLVLQSGAIKVDFSQLPEQQIRDIVDSMIAKDPVTGKYTGGLATNADGKLIVDFSELPSEVMINIVRNMVAPGGGIYYVDDQYLSEGETYIDKNGKVKEVTAAQAAQTEDGFPNPNYGKLLVDFNKMPDDKFDALKASLGMQRTATSATSKFYVNYDAEGASDTIYSKSTGFDSDRGLSLEKPFKTINGALKAITTYYSLGDINVYVYVVPRSNPANPNYPYYKESITCPEYNAGTGTITLCGYIPPDKVQQNNFEGLTGSDLTTAQENAAEMPKILSSSICGGTIYVKSVYNLRYLDVTNRVRDPANGSANYPSVVSVSTTGDATLLGIHEHFEFCGYRGRIGTFSIEHLNAIPKYIKAKASANSTPIEIVGIDRCWKTAEQIEEAEQNDTTVFLGYTYRGVTATEDTNHNIIYEEAERERPTLETSEGHITFISYDTVAEVDDHNEPTGKYTINLKYTFAPTTASDDLTTSCIILLDNESSNQTTVAYKNLESASSVWMRMNSIVGGKLSFSILDKCSIYLRYNLKEDYAATVTKSSTNLVPTGNFTSLVVMRAERHGEIENHSSANITRPYTNVYCHGHTVNFAEINSMSSYFAVTGQVHKMHYAVENGKSATGQAYVLSGGAGMSVPCAIKWGITNQAEIDEATTQGETPPAAIEGWVKGDAGFGFPGDSHGTIEAENNTGTINYRSRNGLTGCWYNESSSIGS